MVHCTWLIRLFSWCIYKCTSALGSRVVSFPLFLLLRFVCSLVASGTCQWWSRHFFCSFYVRPTKKLRCRMSGEARLSAWNWTWNCLKCISCYWIKIHLWGLVPVVGYFDDWPKIELQLAFIHISRLMATWEMDRISCINSRKHYLNNRRRLALNTKNQQKIPVTDKKSKYKLKAIHFPAFIDSISVERKKGPNVLIGQGWTCVYRIEMH